MTPSPKEVSDTLQSIEAAERDTNHSPRSIARAAVVQRRSKIAWQSDAERHGLPVVNLTDTGAPLLDRAGILSHDHHDRRIGRK